jgi:hypothetical protein
MHYGASTMPQNHQNLNFEIGLWFLTLMKKIQII